MLPQLSLFYCKNCLLGTKETQCFLLPSKYCCNIYMYYRRYQISATTAAAVIRELYLSLFCMFAFEPDDDCIHFKDMRWIILCFSFRFLFLLYLDILRRLPRFSSCVLFPLRLEHFLPLYTLVAFFSPRSVFFSADFHLIVLIIYY